MTCEGDVVSCAKWQRKKKWTTIRPKLQPTRFSGIYLTPPSAHRPRT
jgi:hypothetical protein